MVLAQLSGEGPGREKRREESQGEKGEPAEAGTQEVGEEAGVELS